MIYRIGYQSPVLVDPFYIENLDNEQVKFTVDKNRAKIFTVEQANKIVPFLKQTMNQDFEKYEIPNKEESK